MVPKKLEPNENKGFEKQNKKRKFSRKVMVQREMFLEKYEWKERILNKLKKSSKKLKPKLFTEELETN